MFRLRQYSWKLHRENLKGLILLSNFPRFLATPAHTSTALTQRGLTSQIFEFRLNYFLPKGMIGPLELLSKNRSCGQNSIEGYSKRENPERSSYANTAMKSAINCQRKPSLQSSTIEYEHYDFKVGAPQFSRIECMQPSFLCLPWDDVSQYIHPIVEYSFQPQPVFSVNSIVVGFIINVWLNSVRFARYLGQIWIPERIYDRFVSTLGIDEC